MTATPSTTKPGPDQASLRDLLRRLAEATSTDAPIVSAYVDVRPQAHGEAPAARPEIRIVRDRLDAAAGELGAHDVARTSLDADRQRILDVLESTDLAGAEGLAIFACERIGLWEVVRSNDAFDTEVAVGPTADLFQLARMLDDAVATVVAVVSTSTCRLFVTRRGALVERPGPQEDDAEHKRHDQGGWSQARYQRHVDTQDRRFLTEAAEALDRLVRRERAQHVILAGEERAVSTFEDVLTPTVRPLVEHVAAFRVRASTEELADEVTPLLAAIEEADGIDAADRAIAGHRAGDLGVVGIDAAMAALEMGQVDELVIDEAANADEELRNELIRQASLTDARVEVVNGHEGLARHDGIGATLRFRLGDRPRQGDGDGDGSEHRDRDS